MFCLSNVHVLPVKRARLERKTTRKNVCAERLLANGNITVAVTKLLKNTVIKVKFCHFCVLACSESQREGILCYKYCNLSYKLALA